VTISKFISHHEHSGKVGQPKHQKCEDRGNKWWYEFWGIFLSENVTFDLILQGKYPVAEIFHYALKSNIE